MLLRDNEDYVKQALPLVMKAIDRACEAMRRPARYHFYENNSQDGTLAELIKLRARKDVTIHTEWLDEFDKPLLERSTARSGRIADCRNKLVQMARGDIERSGITILIDTNVFCSATNLCVLARALLSRPHVSMATACIGDARKPEHYYDTYAYLGLYEPLDAATERYRCPLNCSWCCKIRAHEPRVPAVHKNQDVIEVQSAFSGLAVIRSEALLQTEWSSENNRCEHVGFCSKLPNKVIVVPSVTGEWCHDFSMFSRKRIIARMTESVRPGATEYFTKYSHRNPGWRF